MTGRDSHGMTFTEVLIGILLVSMVMLSLMTVLQQSERQADDAYFDFIAMSLAREPLEVYRALGYDWFKKQEEQHRPGPFPFPLDTTTDIKDPPPLDLEGLYPALAYECQRSVSFIPVIKLGATVGYEVSVSVMAREDSRLKQWMARRGQPYSLSALILRQPK